MKPNNAVTTRWRQSFTASSRRRPGSIADTRCSHFKGQSYATMDSGLHWSDGFECNWLSNVIPAQAGIQRL